MKVEVEELEGLKKLLKIELSEEEVMEELEKAYRELRKTVQVDGFRVGKVPFGIMRMRFGKLVNEQVGDDLARKYTDKALEEKEIRAVGSPLVEHDPVEWKKPYSFQVTVEILPEISLGDYKNIRVKREKLPVTEEMVDRQLEQLRAQHSIQVPVSDRPSEEGDILQVNLEGIDEEDETVLFGPGDVDIEPGTGRFLPGTEFEESLCGMQPGESKTINLEFPSEYALPTFAGKKVCFKTTLKEIKKREVPELDDEFAADAGDFESLEALKDAIRNQLAIEMEKQSEHQLNEKIIQKVIENSSLEAPEKLVRNRIAMLIGSDDSEKINEAKDQYWGFAENMVKRDLILNEIAETENIFVTENEIEQQLTIAANQEKVEKGVLKEQWEESGKLSNLRANLRIQKVIDFLYSQAEITDEESEEEITEESAAGEAPAKSESDLAEEEERLTEEPGEAGMEAAGADEERNEQIS